MTNAVAVAVSPTFTFTTEQEMLLVESARSAQTATEIKKMLAEELAGKGARGDWFTKNGVASGKISKETWVKLQTLIASGLFQPEVFALWASGSKAAAAIGLQDTRNDCTGEITSYLASFRKMVETAWRKLNPDLAKEEAKEKAKEEKQEKQEKEEPAKMGGDVRAALKALILEVAGSDMENRDAILADLNHAESLMTW